MAAEADGRSVEEGAFPRPDRRELARVYGVAGQSARHKAEAIRHAYPVRSFLGRLTGVHTSEAAWRKGEQGERLIADQLARLPAEWTILHDLCLDDEGHNVDHVAVGPGGVFSLNSKKLTGSAWVRGGDVFVNGQRTSYRGQAKAEAASLASWFEQATGQRPWVEPVLVIVSTRLTVVSQPRDVTVLGRSEVTGWLRDRPERIDQVLRTTFSQALAAVTAGNRRLGRRLA